MTHILALLGITLLCALWMVFQLWLKRADPQRDDFKPGCGACQGGSCGTSNDTTKEIKLDNIKPAARSALRGNLSGENECAEKKSP